MSAPLVLLVDDDAELGEVLQFLLEREGYRSHWVRDGSVALDVIPTLRPELVVTELMLPVMGGLELIGHHARILAMASSRVLLRQALDQGVEAVIHKPFRPDDFIDRVVDLLAGRAEPVSATSSPEDAHPEPNPPLSKLLVPAAECGNRFLEQIASKLGADSALVLLNGSSDSRSMDSSNLAAEEIHTSPFGLLIESQAPVWFDDLRRYSLFARSPWFLRVQHRSFGGVPIWDRSGGFRGCVALTGARAREWSHLDAAILKLISTDWMDSGSRGGVSAGVQPLLDRLLRLKAWERCGSTKGRDTEA